MGKANVRKSVVLPNKYGLKSAMRVHMSKYSFHCRVETQVLFEKIQRKSDFLEKYKLYHLNI